MNFTNLSRRNQYSDCSKQLKHLMMLVIIIILTIPIQVSALTNARIKLSEKGVFLEKLSISEKINSVNITITGTLLDEAGQLLIGASVKLKDGKASTTTDNAGKFVIEVPDKNAILIFSFVGYVTKELSVTVGSVMTVRLAPDQYKLDELVVVGFGTRKKGDITGSVGHADLESFRNAPNSNFIQMLQGTIPGLNIGQVISAGANPSIQVRGQSTISGSTNVLIVLDGIPYTGTMASINPNDIASVDVLKDASSKAIYGATAANGVLLVTTKKGKRGDKPQITFSSSYAKSDPAHVPEILDRDAFINKVRDINWRTAFLAPDYLTPNPAFVLRNRIDGTQQTAFDDGTNYDWYEAGTNSGYLLNQELSISNATEKTNYFLSGGYTKQKGFVINDKFTRKSTRLNLETKALDWLKFGVQAFGSFMDYSGASPDIRPLLLLSPLNVPYTATGDYIISPNGSLTNPFLINEVNDFDRRNNLSANFYTSVDIPYVKGLSYRLNFGNNIFWNQQYAADKYGGGFTGSVSKFNSHTYDYTLDNIVDYKRTFGKSHDVELTMVYGSREANFNSTSASATGYTNIALGYNSIQQGQIQRTSSSAYSEAYNYQLGRLNYTFDNKYLLTASLRRDGFSGFAENYKYTVFPSAAIAWMVSKESFLKNVKLVNNLKLRAGYGSNGNLTSRYSSIARVSQGAAYIFGDGSTSTLFGQQVSSLGNDDLKWETTTGLNLGLDFAVLNNRISGAVDYYNTNTNDLLFNVTIPSITGFSSISTNIGQINNRGLEISLTGKIINRDAFKWDMTTDFSRNSNKVMRLTGQDANNDGIEDDLISNNLFIGRSLGTIYNYVQNGFWQVGETPPSGYFTGSEKLVDVNNDGVVNASDRVFSGITLPAYRFSLQNTFSYKQFSLMVFINSVQGGKDSYQGSNDPWIEGGVVGVDNATRHNWFKDVNYWTPQNPNAEYRVPGISPAIDPTVFKSRSFIRLQDVSFSYAFSKAILDKMKVKNLQLHVSGKNLATWTKWKGWDPETGQGLLHGGNPVLKSINIGLNVTL